MGSVPRQLTRGGKSSEQVRGASPRQKTRSCVGPGAICSRFHARRSEIRQRRRYCSSSQAGVCRRSSDTPARRRTQQRYTRRIGHGLPLPSRYPDSPRSEPGSPRVDLERPRTAHDLPGSRRPGYDQNSSLGVEVAKALRTVSNPAVLELDPTATPPDLAAGRRGRCFLARYLATAACVQASSAGPGRVDQSCSPASGISSHTLALSGSRRMPQRLLNRRTR
jgi:hypothetical protein